MMNMLKKMAIAKTHMAWILALVLLQLSGRSLGVRITHMNVPKVALEGDDIHLRCDYEEDFGDPLYSFKWYKDGWEFYRHLPATPKNQEDMCIGERADIGVKVDCYSSTERDVVLRDITQQTSGEYQCEVIGDQPKFRKESRRANLTVHSEPLQRPHITGAMDSYSSYDHVALNCTSMNNEYFPDITWSINDKPADPTFLQKYDQRTSSLTFQASQSFFKRGVIRVSCTVTLGMQHFNRTDLELTNRDFLSAQEYHLNHGETRVPDASCIITLFVLPWIFASLFSFV